MKILGIDTVTKIGSLAVVEDKRIIGETTIDMHLMHAAELIPCLHSLLCSLGITINDINLIAVDNGPGSFTGIRVGIASALGLALPGSLPLAGICSLEVLGHQVLQNAVKDGMESLIPVIDAKRGKIYSASYKIDKNELRCVKDPYLTTVDELKKQLLPHDYVFGPELNNEYPRAGTAAILAERKRKEGFPQKELEPIYIHDVEYRV